jgi:Rrf2 family protein
LKEKILLNKTDKQSDTLLELSAKVEYALLALMELASHRDLKNPLTINEIAARQPIPERYLEQICNILRRGGIIQSQRGAKGGYVLLQDPWQVTVLQIFTLVEGTRAKKEPHNVSSVERDVVEGIWEEANLKFQQALSRYTLQELCQRRDTYKQKNPMYYI